MQIARHHRRPQEAILELAMVVVGITLFHKVIMALKY